MKMRYQVQLRYQDSQWENHLTPFEFCGDAICEASEVSVAPGVWAMTRVVDLQEKRIVITYAGGGGIIKNQ